MKLLIDQNSLRKEPLRDFLSTSTDNYAVLTDMAMFEMLKGVDPDLTSRNSLSILSQFPNQVICTQGTGVLMDRELREKKRIDSPEDAELTERMRRFLISIREYNADLSKGHPIDLAAKQSIIDDAKLQRLDHQDNIQSLKKGVAEIRINTTAELQKKFRKELLDQEVYDFIVKTWLLNFVGVTRERSLLDSEAIQLYSTICLTARYTICHILSSIQWFADGGSDSILPEEATNDVNDVDYVVLSSYFDGILSKEKRVNRLHSKFIKILKKEMA
jgi:hypothetical protein